METLSRAGSRAIICRSLKMRDDADNFNNGYIYEMGDLIEMKSIIAVEKEEFPELAELVKSKSNYANP